MARRSIFALIRSRLFAGLFAILPALLTIWLLFGLWQYLDGTFQPAIESFLGHRLPGLGIAITLIVLYFVGAIFENTLLNPIVLWSERLIRRVPFAGTIYTAVRQAIDAFDIGSNPEKFNRVVFLQFPHPGLWALGFVTADIEFKGEKSLSVFVPTSPLPTAGFVVVVKETEVIPANISVENATKYIVSAGALAPQSLVFKSKSI